MVTDSQRERAARSDSTRNREAILDAAAECLVANPRSSLANIAQAAGVGRVTLYGHFASRNELLLALLHERMARVEAQLASVDLSGPAWQALDALVASSWRLFCSLNALRGVIEQALPSSEMHASHSNPRARVEHLRARGRADGLFRTDQTLEWQVAAKLCAGSPTRHERSDARAPSTEPKDGRLTERPPRANNELLERLPALRDG